jgi:hypothetical protein
MKKLLIQNATRLTEIYDDTFIMQNNSSEFRFTGGVTIGEKLKNWKIIGKK